MTARSRVWATSKCRHCGLTFLYEDLVTINVCGSKGECAYCAALYRTFVHKQLNPLRSDTSKLELDLLRQALPDDRPAPTPPRAQSLAEAERMVREGAL